MIRNDFTQATYSRLDAGNRLYSGHVLKVFQKVGLGMTSGGGWPPPIPKTFFLKKDDVKASVEGGCLMILIGI